MSPLVFLLNGLIAFTGIRTDGGIAASNAYIHLPSDAGGGGAIVV